MLAVLAGLLVATTVMNGNTSGSTQRQAARPAASLAADPSTAGQWGPLLNWPLVAVHSALLNTGQVLTWDAWETGGTPSVRLWNPTSQAFTSVPNQTSQIFCSAHVQLPDGRLLVIGGHNGGEYGIRDTTLFDPTTSQWSKLANMSYARWYPSATVLGDGRVAAVSGQITPGNYADTPEMWSPQSQTWSTLSGVNSSFVHDDGYPLSFLLPDGRLWIFDPEGGHLGALDTRTGTLSTLPSSPVTFGSAAMYRPGKILVSGGGSGWGASTNGSTEVMDASTPTPTWRAVAPMSYGRYQHDLVTLADGEVMAIGGSSSVDQADVNGPLPAEIWNPATETWTTVAATANPRMYHSTALLLPDGRVLAAGGGRWSTAKDYQTAEVYSPPYLFKGSRPVITSAPASTGYASTMSVQTPDASSIATVALVGLGSVTHTLDMDQRWVPLNFTSASGSLNVQAPTDYNLAPPGYYMMFLIDSSGVPSVARFVQLVRTTDSQAPSTSVTAPAPGATVSGTSVTLSASASDNVGVSAVQLLVDGTPLGSRLTFPPYSVTLDSTTLSNGSHALTSMAWDAAGNSSTSAPVSITVANASAPPTISSVAASSVTSSAATISWMTDRAADSQVDYGLTTAYGLQTSLNPALVTSHSQQITGLAPATVYHYRVRSRDGSGSLSVSGDYTLKSAAAPPTFRAASTATNASSVNKPAGVAAGDLLLASLEIDADPVSVTGPAGWTRISDTLVGGGTSSVFHAQLWYHVAGSSEPSSYGWGGTAGAWVDVGLLDYANVSTASPIDGFIARDAGVTATPATGSVTTTSPNDMLVAIFMDYSFGSWTAGSGMTKRFDFDSNLAEDALQPSPGSSGTRTATNSSSGRNAALLVALTSTQTDGQPPSVGVTSPSAGATVFGSSVALVASASDNVGVTGLQFSVDGGAVGPVLAAPPYSFNWDSTTASNGAHSITARAWDAAGNAATSSAVPVAVSNRPPPVISSVAAGSLSTSSAVVTWTTDEPADSQVDYGLTTAYGTQTALDPTPVTSHTQQLTGLSPGTLYHFRVRSRDAAGQLSTSADSTLATLVSGPPVISQVQAGSVTSTGATITWSTDTPSDSQVAYGTSSSYGSSTALDSALTTSHGQQLSGLNPGTQYHFQVRSRDRYGNLSTSADYAFTTAATAPVINNVQANAVTTTSATIQWTTDIPSSSQVEYGTTGGYGSSTALDSNLVTSHSQTLSGLSPGTAYHYRVRSVASGSGAVSGDFAFTTAAAAPSFRSRTTVTNGFTVGKPAGVTSGDLMLANLEIDADPATVTAPAGWSLLLDTTAGTGTAKVFHSQLWYRVAGGSEPSTYTWRVNGSPYTDIAVLAYTNVSTTSPIDASSGRDAGSTSSPTTPAVTTSFTNEMLVALFIDWDYGTWTAGSGMTKRYDFDSLTAEDVVAGPAGAVPPKTATNTASGPSTAQIVTLRGR
jgi:hypothetical protein